MARGSGKNVHRNSTRLPASQLAFRCGIQKPSYSKKLPEKTLNLFKNENNKSKVS